MEFEKDKWYKIQCAKVCVNIIRCSSGIETHTIKGYEYISLTLTNGNKGTGYEKSQKEETWTDIKKYEEVSILDYKEYLPEDYYLETPVLPPIDEDMSYLIPLLNKLNIK